MKGFLFGVAACAAVFALSSFAFWHVAPSPARQQAGPIKLSDLPLNRSFQVHGLATTSTGGGQNGFGFDLAFPPTAGVALSQITRTWDSNVIIKVNGSLVCNWATTTGLTKDPVIRFDPPIIVPPGGTLRLEGMNFGNDLTLGGWTLGPGDL